MSVLGFLVKYLDRHLKQLTAVIENWKNIGKFHKLIFKTNIKVYKARLLSTVNGIWTREENNLALKCDLMQKKLLYQYCNGT